MATEVKRFSEAYATMTVAAYEPLILHWISLIGVRFISNAAAYRLPKASAVKFDGKTPAALALSRTIRKPIPREIDYKVEDRGMHIPVDVHGRAVNPDEVKKVKLADYPNAVAVGKDVYLSGFSATEASELVKEQGQSISSKEGIAARLLLQARAQMGTLTQGLRTIPMAIAGRLGVQAPDFDFLGSRDELQNNLVRAAQDWSKDPGHKDLMQLMISASKVAGITLPHMWPGSISIHEALSPIGIAHYCRQLYFNKEEGAGPIEEAFTIAPLETFEVMYETVRKQIHEEVLEQGLEVVSESAVEEKNLDEVSDKVSSMVQQDVSASMSANASGGIGVWQVGASATASFGTSSQRSREFSSRRLKEVTKRASERITKSFSIKTRDTTEVTETTTTRRVIRNDGAAPVNYGLRRILRRVNVKVQDLGPRLVWQLYLRNPGEGLARSRFVHFRETGPITVPDIPPGLPPRPGGGVESESTTTSIKWDGSRHMYYVTIVVKPGDDRVVTGVRIENITDLEGGGKDDKAPAPHNESRN